MILVWFLTIYGIAPGLFGCCLFVKNDRKSCDFAVKRFVLYGFNAIVGGEMGLYVECVT